MAAVWKTYRYRRLRISLIHPKGLIWVGMGNDPLWANNSTEMTVVMCKSSQRYPSIRPSYKSFSTWQEREWSAVFQNEKIASFSMSSSKVILSGQHQLLPWVDLVSPYNPVTSKTLTSSRPQVRCRQGQEAPCKRAPSQMPTKRETPSIKRGHTQVWNQRLSKKTVTIVRW